MRHSKAIQEKIDRASNLYSRFTGHTIDTVTNAHVPNLPAVALVIGDVDGLLYTTIRDSKQEKYIHKFKAKDRPLFVVSDDGKQIFLLGGNFDFTEQGIVDRS
ncbi:MAG TPA: hypothetical protein VJ521_01755 [Acidobacteriota bacterium]|nr:hypothetical protein [Acidobacteriota bacterium]